MSAQERGRQAAERAERARQRADELDERVRHLREWRADAGGEDASVAARRAQEAAAALARARTHAWVATHRADAAQASASRRARPRAARPSGTAAAGRWAGVPAVRQAVVRSPERHEVLDLARRCAEMSVTELWEAYWALGGEAGAVELEAHLCGLAPWTTHEQDVLAHALNEHLQEAGLGRLVPYWSFANPSAAPPALFAALHRLLA